MVKPHVRPKTYTDYSALVERYIKPRLGHVHLTKLKPEHVQRMLAKMLEDGRSGWIARYTRRVLSIALNRAVKWGKVARNVAALTDVPKVSERAGSPLTREQSRALLRAVQGHKWEALFVVALAEGLRQGEILGLHWKDVDLEAAQLTVNWAVQRVGGKLKLVEPKTKASRRTIPISGRTIQALCEHKARQEAQRRLAGSLWQENDLVFPTGIGTLLDARNLFREYKRILEQAGVPDHRFHDLRHTCSTLLQNEARIPPRVVQSKLGHTNLSTTMRYTHSSTEAEREAARAMNDILSESKD